jgi:hypothetical protein
LAVRLLATLLASSGFFAMSETCLMSVNRYRLKHLIREGSRGARLAGALLDKIDELLSFILAGNTCSTPPRRSSWRKSRAASSGTGEYVLASPRPRRASSSSCSRRSSRR